MKKIIMLVIFSFCCGQHVYAKSTKNIAPATYKVQNNDLVKITLSRVDLNRIFVKDDKVKAIHCPASLCTLNKHRDSDGGVLLNINPPSRVTKKGVDYSPFTAFIDTENGKHFSTLIIPLAVPAQTSIFEVDENPEQKISLKRKSVPWDRFLVDLMAESVLAFRHNKSPENFVRYNMKDDYQPCGFTDADICINETKVNALPLVIFHGGDFNVLIYKLYNPLDHDVEIKQSDFYVRGLVSGSLYPNINPLPSKEFTYMYQIVDGSGDAPYRGLYE